MEIYAGPDQHFKIPMLNLWMSWENLCPNLSFNVKSKMENSHNRGWSHFKLKIDDWDIAFPKAFVELVNELEKIFSIEENGTNPLGW